MKKSIKALAIVTAIAVFMGIGTVFAVEIPVFEKTDRFYIAEDFGWNALLSSDGELVILIADGTPIIFEDDIDVREGLIEDETLIEFLNGRNLIISYSITTRSIPPQTTPEKIVVLNEQTMPVLPGVDIETDDEADIETDYLIDDLDQEEIEEIAVEIPVFEKTGRFYIAEDFGLNALLSSDGELVIRIADNTPIIFEDDIDAREGLIEGETLIEFLNGRNLIVGYSVTTRSIPPQTTPEKIVVLHDE